MKKFISMLMVSAMVFVMSVSAFAAASPTTPGAASGVDKDGNPITVSVAPAVQPTDAEIQSMMDSIGSAATQSALKLFTTIDITSTSGNAPYTITAEINGLSTSGYSKVFLFHNVNGTWEQVTIKSIDGNKLTFTVDSLSPFAVMIEQATSPVTGVTSNLTVVLAIAALATGVAFVSTRKRTA